MRCEFGQDRRGPVALREHDTMKGLFDYDDVLRVGSFLGAVVGAMLIIGGALAFN